MRHGGDNGTEHRGRVVWWQDSSRSPPRGPRYAAGSLWGTARYAIRWAGVGHGSSTGRGGNVPPQARAPGAGWGNGPARPWGGGGWDRVPRGGGGARPQGGPGRGWGLGGPAVTRPRARGLMAHDPRDQRARRRDRRRARRLHPDR